MLKEYLTNHCYSDGEGDYTEERREKIEKLNREDFHKFLKERGEM